MLPPLSAGGDMSTIRPNLRVFCGIRSTFLFLVSEKQVNRQVGSSQIPSCVLWFDSARCYTFVAVSYFKIWYTNNLFKPYLTRCSQTSTFALVKLSSLRVLYELHGFLIRVDVFLRSIGEMVNNKRWSRVFIQCSNACISFRVPQFQNSLRTCLLSAQLSC